MVLFKEFEQGGNGNGIHGDTHHFDLRIGKGWIPGIGVQHGTVTVNTLLVSKCGHGLFAIV